MTVTPSPAATPQGFNAATLAIEIEKRFGTAVSPSDRGCRRGRLPSSCGTLPTLASLCQFLFGKPAVLLAA